MSRLKLISGNYEYNSKHDHAYILHFEVKNNLYSNPFIKKPNLDVIEWHWSAGYDDVREGELTFEFEQFNEWVKAELERE